MDEKRISLYRTAAGKVPFADWLAALDRTARKRIEIGVDKLSLGYLPDCKHLAEGVLEMRLPFGPGYRVYFGLWDREIIILLCGGDKHAQRKDIKRAVSYWLDFQRRMV